MTTLPAELRHYVSDRDSHDITDPLARVNASAEWICLGATYHSPRPLFLIEAPLIPADWPDAPKNVETVVLCGTCYDNLTVYEALLYEYDGEVPWSLRREIGNMTRALGDQGWRLYQEARNG